VTRRLTVAFAVVVLLALVVGSGASLRDLDREDPLGKDLLYLPSAEMLRLLSLGNEGLMADLVYLWSIQYYSQFRPHEQFLYLEKVYDLITDLDPLYFDAYRIGAMIMSIELSTDPAARKLVITKLYDKGLRNMSGSWELAEVAAWDALQQLHDPDLALHYAAIGARHPDAPARLKRVYGRWKERVGGWSIEDSIAYWQEVLAEAERKPDEVLAKSHLYDAWVQLDHRRLDPVLAWFQQRFGRCPSSWQEVVDRGLLAEVPRDYVGNPYRIAAGRCRLEAHKRIRWD
jgi:hypothetical protein